MGPVPFSPVHNALKFSAVLGTMSANNSKTMRPTEMTENEKMLSPGLGTVIYRALQGKGSQCFRFFDQKVYVKHVNQPYSSFS